MERGHKRINSFVTDFNLMLEEFLFSLIFEPYIKTVQQYFSQCVYM